MSHLLRKANKRGQWTRGVGGTSSFSNRSNFSRPKPVVGATSRGGGQTQQLLTRRPVSQQRVAQRETGQLKKQTNEHGVISMEEVMADLRILEEQQRESQRKLAAVKLTKEQRLQKLSALEQKLQSSKYSNGEQRARLLQVNDLLAICTRDFGSRRLRSDRAADQVRGFDARLKRGLAAARRCQVKRRNATSIIVLLCHKQSVLCRLNEDNKEEAKLFEKKHEEALQHDASLRRRIHEQSLRAQRATDESSKLMPETTKLEAELGSAQKTEASTKIRSDELVSQIRDKEARHSKVAAAAEKELAELKKAKEQAQERARELVLRRNSIQKEILEASSRIMKLLETEGHTIGPTPREGQQPPSLDLDRLRSAAEDEAKALKDEVKNRDKLEVSVQVLRRELASAEDNEEETRRKTKTTETLAEEKLAVEKGRKVAAERFLSDLDKMESDVDQLHRSLSELQLQRKEDTKKAKSEETTLNQEVLIQQEKVASLNLELQSHKKSIEAVKATWENEKEKMAELVGETDHRAEVAKQKFETVRAAVDELLSISDLETTKAVETLRKAWNLEKDEEETRITESRTEFPELKLVTFKYDPEKAEEEQTEDSLRTLISHCADRIDAAKEVRDKSKQRADLERKAADETKRREQGASKRARLERRQSSEYGGRGLDQEGRNARRQKEGHTSKQPLQDDRMEHLGINSGFGSPANSHDGSQTAGDAGALYSLTQQSGGGTDDDEAEPRELFPVLSGKPRATAKSPVRPFSQEKRVRWDDERNGMVLYRPKKETKERQGYGTNQRGMKAITSDKTSTGSAKEGTSHHKRHSRHKSKEPEANGTGARHRGRSLPESEGNNTRAKQRRRSSSSSSRGRQSTSKKSSTTDLVGDISGISRSGSRVPSKHVGESLTRLRKSPSAKRVPDERASHSRSHSNGSIKAGTSTHVNSGTEATNSKQKSSSPSAKRVASTAALHKTARKPWPLTTSHGSKIPTKQPTSQTSKKRPRPASEPTQASGISSTEKGPRARRRRKTGAAKKSSTESFATEYGFNF